MTVSIVIACWDTSGITVTMTIGVTCAFMYMMTMTVVTMAVCLLTSPAGQVVTVGVHGTTLHSNCNSCDQYDNRGKPINSNCKETQTIAI
jgi:hypothetical protein